MRSQNDHDPEKAVVKFLMDSVLSFKEMLFESSKQQDNITVWLVGMSTAALALLVSQYGKFSPGSDLALKLAVYFSNRYNNIRTVIQDIPPVSAATRTT